MKLKYDFMGYEFKKLKDLSFHHIIIPSSLSPIIGMERGYYEWNGVMLVHRTSHEYLHIVETFDLDRFYAITSEMLDEKIKGYISLDNLKAIDDILTSFEREYTGQTFKGSRSEIIKPAYTIRLLKNRY